LKKNIKFNKNIGITFINCIFFTKIMTKLRQKLNYKDKIENKDMTPDIILIRDIITVTSLCYCYVT